MRAWLAAVMFSSLVWGCRPRVGSSCEAGEARCVDGVTALVCQGGAFVATPCKGPKGCASTPKGTACDYSGNLEGEACSTDDEGSAACASPTQLIACRGGSYRLSPCTGPRGCEVAGAQASCDTSVAAAGAACREGERACAADGKQLLRCKEGKLEALHFCRGKDGCKSSAGKLSCDMSAADIDDPCAADMSGNVACSTDGAHILICKGQRFGIDEVCKKGTRCDAERDSITCARD